MKYGLWLSFITVWFWAFYDVVVRYLGVTWDVQPLVFTALVNLVASLALLTVAGKGPLGVHTLKQAHTWIYSFCMILMDILFIFLVLYASATETNFIMRTTIITSALLCWFALGRKITKWQVPGLLLVLAGVCMVANSLPADNKGVFLFIVGIMIICHTVRTFVTETHPSTDEAEAWADKSRVAGYVLMITSIGFLVLALCAALAVQGADLPESLVSALPALHDFVDPYSVISATILGLFVIAPSNYMYFQAAKKAGADGFLIVSAFLPLFTLGFEFIASRQGLLDISSIQTHDLLGGGLIITGAVLGVLVKVFNLEAKPSKKQRTYMNHAQGHVHAAIEYFQGDRQAAAKALGIKPSTMVHITAKSKIYKDSTYKRIKANFDERVFSKDPVTNLQTRMSYLANVNIKMSEHPSGMLFFIDLNKFKPVNDVHGHAAGDAVLYKIADRLRFYYGNEAQVTRLGGDEFSLFFHKFTEMAETVATQIKDIIAEHIHVVGIEEPLQVTASVGYAHFPDDAKTARELLSHADKNMYKEKSER